MNELKTLDSELNDAQAAGALALGHYASLCLRYADAVEQLHGGRGWCFVSEGIGYSSNEYLLARIANELSNKGLVAETLSVLELIHRSEFANAVRGRILPRIASVSSDEQLRHQLQALSTDDVNDLLTGAEVCGKSGEYAEGLEWLSRALDRLQGASGPEIEYWTTWNRVADILDGYPPDDATLKIVLRARQVVLTTQGYGPGSHEIIGLLAKFEARTSSVQEILDTLPSTPARGAIISPADVANRTRARRWAERGDWARALELATRVQNPEYRLYTLNDVAGILLLDWVGYAERLLELGKTAVANLLGKKSRGLVQADINRQARRSDRHNQALALVEEAKAIAEREKVPKARASKQHHVLKNLLAIGEFQPAWEVLGLLVDTLEQTPAFSKHEFRAGDVAKTLLPYVSNYPQVVYHFVTELLRRDARHSYWQTVHGISAILPLMLTMGGPESLLDLAAFLANWSAGAGGD